MRWKVYTRLMRPVLQDYEPEQPNREDRRFLRYAEKPQMPNVKPGDGFYLESQPLVKVAPRLTVDGLNFKALQYWLDHLGAAIYNPITAYRDDEGKYHLDKDGGHRTQCLWEIGEPSIRVLTRRTRKRTKPYFRWVKAASRHFATPVVPHFKVNPSMTWRQYYPCIYPPSKTLSTFYEEPKDGVYYKDTLDTPMSFKDILSQNKHLSYRMDILNEILKFPVKDKSILDLGCYFGHYMFLLLEHGVKEVIGIDNNRFRVKVTQEIAVRRGINRSTQSFKAVYGDINDYVESMKNGVDVVLLLNVFHHLLYHDEARAWDTLNKLLDNCDALFLMTGNVKGVYDKWGGNIVEAVEEKTGTTLKPLIKTRYRNRVLWSV